MAGQRKLITIMKAQLRLTTTKNVVASTDTVVKRKLFFFFVFLTTKIQEYKSKIWD